MRSTARLVLVLTFALPAAAQFGPPQPPQPGQPGQPGMAPGMMPPGGGPGGPGPANGHLRLALLDDFAGEPTSRLFIQGAGVPSLARLGDGTIVAAYQWFPMGEPDSFDRVAVQFSYDDGVSWTLPESIVVEGFPEAYQRPFDPTLVELDDGTLRLYFTSGPAAMLGLRGGPGPDTAIYRADSEDGLHYSFDPEAVWQNPDNQPTFDPAVVRVGDTWHLICPRQPAGAYHATSVDGLLFHPAAEIPPARGQQWIGNLVAVGDTIRFYGGGPMGLWYAEFAEGAGWSGPQAVGLPGGDPAVLPLDDGRLMLLFVNLGMGMGPPPGMPGMPGGGMPPDQPPQPGRPPQPPGAGGLIRR